MEAKSQDEKRKLKALLSQGEISARILRPGHADLDSLRNAISCKPDQLHYSPLSTVDLKRAAVKMKSEPWLT